MNKATLNVFLSAVLFAIGGLFFKLIPWDAMAINSARCFLAAICILIFLKIRKHHFKVNGTVLISAAAIAATNILYASANKLTAAGNVIVLEFTMPIFVILIMFLFYHHKPSGLEIVTCILVFGGVVCFFIDSLSSGNMLGDCLSLLSGFTYALFFIANSREDSEPFTSILLSYLISFLLGLPSLLKADIAGSSSTVLLAVLALGIFQQGAAQIFLALGIKKTSPVAASLISGVEPILNPVLVAIFYHEMLPPLSLFGAFIVLTSILAYNIFTTKKDGDPV